VSAERRIAPEVGEISTMKAGDANATPEVARRGAPAPIGSGTTLVTPTSCRLRAACPGAPHAWLSMVRVDYASEIRRLDRNSIESVEVLKARRAGRVPNPPGPESHHIRTKTGLRGRSRARLYAFRSPIPRTTPAHRARPPRRPLSPPALSNLAPRKIRCVVGRAPCSRAGHRLHRLTT
jgi:hypothetical protein